MDSGAGILMYLPYFLNIQQVLVLSVLLFLAVRLIRRSAGDQTAVFFTFWLAQYLLTDLYWLIYDLMIGSERRMPFAANEIGEAALLLLEAAILSSAIGCRPSLFRKTSLAALFFSAANVVLWICWSGEWGQDFLIGIPFSYLLLILVSALELLDVLSRGEWAALGGVCALLIAGQAAVLFAPERIRLLLDTSCYLLMAAGLLCWAEGLRRAYQKKASPQVMLTLVLALIIWETMSRYMSEDLWYLAFYAAETVFMPLVYLAVRKAVQKER